jgi:MFS family permease
MAFTGVGFSVVTRFWPLVVVGFIGTLNPSGGDVSLFLPMEQAALADLTTEAERPHRFAIYNLGAALAAAAGALASALPRRLATANGWDVVRVERLSFLLYVITAVIAAFIYRGLRTDKPAGDRGRGLHKSRKIVIRLSALFSLDAAGGGFAVNALLVLYLDLRFGLSPAVIGATLAAAGTLSAFSQLAAAPLARRIGLVRTMVFTHLPANAFLILAGIVPSAPIAITLLLMRAAFSQMDVPVRQALVMRLVDPDERAAAASLTNVPRTRRLPAPPDDLRLAAHHRRHHEGDLRPAPAPRADRPRLISGPESPGLVSTELATQTVRMVIDETRGREPGRRRRCVRPALSARVRTDHPHRLSDRR